MRFACLSVALAVAGPAAAQFVYPKPEYNIPEPGLYTEDPFIVKYRKEFFSVFRGDFQRFERAYDEIARMVQRNPNDARAIVWLGNGKTVKAGLLFMKGKKTEALPLLEQSRKDLDRAVALRPKDPNIYMMRAATLYIQGQYWSSNELPRAN